MTTLALSGCSEGVLAPEGPISAAERTILINSLGIMLAVVVPTLIAVAAVAWWFRASNRRATYLPDFTFSGQIELVIWAIPMMVVLLLGGIAWIGSHALDPPRPIASRARPVLVEVVSLDWKWLFIYPELGIASVNRLVVPAGTPVRFRLTSASVMNSFFVPQLGSQIYTMAGMTTRLNLMADRPGRFAGISAHFSGERFSDMRFTVSALPPARFASWASATRGRGPMLDARGYAALARRGVAVPGNYGGVAPGLFDAVVRMQAPPSNLPVAAGGSRTEG
ncbi:ubiquinol oxidase subunit II [Sphingomonas bacterium]|uniref:ubiquinol oxidase subunit II n=1 Tax=Sphingomonas bacterium TaxID=1895847 RepID=UPI001575A494|nr:ubiquinol oxidase subunit II [Sphingomonas bacterium]